MDRLSLERRQVWIYLAAIVGGLVLGSVAPGIGPRFEALLWPVLAALLYTTFVQVPLLHVRDAFRDGRFVLAILLGNFVFIPLLVWLALQFLPDDPALRLGVLLVLLVPCTDWFITFTQLGRGSTARAIAVTPLNLLLQLLLLPAYLWLMLPAADFSAALKTEEMLPAALVLIGLPLVAAVLTERWIEARPERTVWRERLGWWPVPLLAVVVFLIAGAQVGTVLDAGPVLLTVLPVFVGFLLVAALLARSLSHWLRLPLDAGRTLAFSLGTRNSFVVLPFALALPAGWETTVVVIVFQSLVELFGMVFYLWWLPRHLFILPGDETAISRRIPKQ
ncbi:arsenic resistance protein [Castellaniella defragrans]|uniref:ACR3 family arsenite efflux pump ArsB n=1 Tax=Castellaniella defragrans TaxID=75697 RepID=A0A7W9TME1_CASDE|nr:arsenic resistance protein [Castellaniella defragrans]KAB0624425.1 arsenic resistance protein [Castellaniella defragrans]MBB6082558.1 ACR3 family arsenite efflux pump ArsB [Castellaniella defragrans]HBO5486887.1 arsenic resistance protein [Pseudomonas aeruginosa]HBO5506164.1 arsenic resistance protein [Pseudomonas aeruginosa]